MGPPHDDGFCSPRQAPDGCPRHDRVDPSRQATPESFGFARVAATAAGTASARSDRSFSADDSGLRTRRCLLRGCEQPFQPRHPLARYCGPACQAAARCWSRSRAAARYRVTERGRACRRQQVCRYRQRVRERRETAAAEVEAACETPAETACEGHQEAEDSEKIRCHRPGCYERFSLTPRSPGQRFCGPLCRQALRRVRERERRWRRRFAQRRGASSFWRRPAADDG